MIAAGIGPVIPKDATFELPVKIVSKPGAEYRAVCRGQRGSSTSSMVTAMQRAAAKALNVSAKLTVKVHADDVTILGAGRERTARYELGKAVRA